SGKWALIRLFHSRQEPGKGTLSNPVRTDHPEHFPRAYLPGGYLKPEPVVALAHCRELEKECTFGMLLVCTLLEHHRVLPEPHILFREVALQVLIDPDTHPFRLGDNPKNGRFSVGDMDGIRKHVEDRKIVLDDHDRPGGSKFPDDPGGSHPLVDVQEWGDLIEEVEVSLAGKAGHDCHALEL